jgi:uncharacterized protein (DUF433 family)
MYDTVEAACLVGVSPARLLTWSRETSSHAALVVPSLNGMYSFHELVSLYLVAQLVRRGVRLAEIAQGIRTLSAQLETETPLAHEALADLATAGRAFMARAAGDGEEWVDVGLGGQRAFQSVIEPSLRQIEYGADHLARIWRPRERIALNPEVQAGAACVQGTRITTATIMRIVAAGDDVEDVAEDYDLEVEDVVAALEFEQGLRAAA